MARCRIVYDFEDASGRPYIIVKQTIDRRHSNIIFTCLDRFRRFEDAQTAMPTYDTTFDRRVG